MTSAELSHIHHMKLNSPEPIKEAAKVFHRQLEHGPLPRATAIEELSRLWHEGAESGDVAPLDAEDIKRRGGGRLAATRNSTR